MTNIRIYNDRGDRAALKIDIEMLRGQINELAEIVGHDNEGTLGGAVSLLETIYDIALPLEEEEE